MVAQSMYSKGKIFLGAAVLLQQKVGYEYVVIHLMCQGMENVLKALLLFKYYDKYRGQLKRPLGHDLEKLVATLLSEFGAKPMSHAFAGELKALNSLYSDHLLRYGSFCDIFVDPQEIPSALTLRKIGAVIRLADRHVTAQAPII